MIFIYAVVQFYPWFNFNFPLFLGMVMYGNETKDKIEPQHFHQNDVGKGAGVERYQVYTQTLALPTSSFFFSELAHIHVFKNWWSFLKLGYKIWGGGGRGWWVPNLDTLPPYFEFSTRH